MREVKIEGTNICEKAVIQTDCILDYTDKFFHILIGVIYNKFGENRKMLKVKKNILL